MLLADTATGDQVERILAAAATRGVEVRRVPAHHVNRVSRNGRQDQGVVADVVARRLGRLDATAAAALEGPVLVLDGVTNPQNVGMILRTAVATDVAHVVVPDVGVAEIGPLVVKASAGVALEAPILRVRAASDAVSMLRTAGFRLYGLTAGGGRLLWDPAPFSERAAFVLGGETTGVAVEVDEQLAIPMAGGVDSLNVAVAAGVLCFELVRRRLVS